MDEVIRYGLDRETGEPLLYYQLLGCKKSNAQLLEDLHQYEVARLVTQRFVDTIKLNENAQAKLIPHYKTLIKLKKRLSEFREAAETMQSEASAEFTSKKAKMYQRQYSKRKRNVDQLILQLQKDKKTPPTDPFLPEFSIELARKIERVEQQLADQTQKDAVMRSQLDFRNQLQEKLHNIFLATLKKSYHSEARKFHPDRASDPHSTEIFQMIAKAYEVILDRKKREEYNYTGNHTIYSVTHNDETDFSFTDPKDRRRSKARQFGTLRLTSGVPQKMPVPDVVLEGSHYDPTLNPPCTATLCVSWPASGDYSYVLQQRNDDIETEFSTVANDATSGTLHLKKIPPCQISLRVAAKNLVGMGPFSEPKFIALSILEKKMILYDPYATSAHNSLSADANKSEGDEFEQERKRRNKERKKQRKDERKRKTDSLLALGTKISATFRATRNDSADKIREIWTEQETEGEQKYDDQITILFNWQNKSGETVVVMAAKNNKIAALASLLRLSKWQSTAHRIDFHATDNKKGMTALMWAIANHNADAAHLLINEADWDQESGGYGCDFDVLDFEGFTCLHWAIRLGMSDVVSRLVKKGADVDVACYDDNNRTALHLACELADFELVQLLVSKSAAYNIDAENDEAEEMRLSLLKFCVLQDVQIEILIFLTKKAEAMGDMEFKKQLLAVAVLMENEDFVEFLIECSTADVINSQNDEGNSALHHAYRTKNQVIIDMLLRADSIDTSLRNANGHLAYDDKNVFDSESEGDDTDSEQSAEDSELELAVIDAIDTENPDDYLYYDSSFFALLPPEVLVRILSHVDYTDIFRLRLVCRKFAACGDDSSVWEALFSRVFPFRKASIIVELLTEQKMLQGSKKKSKKKSKGKRRRNFRHQSVPADEEEDIDRINWKAAFMRVLSRNNHCFICGRIDRLFICTGCLGVHYCSSEHQLLHWQYAHKFICSFKIRRTSTRSRAGTKKALSVFHWVKEALEAEEHNSQKPVGIDSLD